MGLDIYLYKYENKDKSEELENRYSELSEASWQSVGEYDSLTQQQKNILRQKDKEIANELGLNPNGESSEKTTIEFNSKKYPEHLFKIGYLRSSYNDGGINNVLRKWGVPGLYEIFNYNKEEYKFQPDWDSVIKKTAGAIDLLKQKPNLTCFDISWNDFKNPSECQITDEKKALEIFLKENTNNRSYDSYSNIHGTFNLKEPLKVYGLISGVKKMILQDILLPCTYVVAEGDNTWYIQALEIVVETAEYVKSQADMEKYWLHWSG